MAAGVASAWVSGLLGAKAAVRGAAISGEWSKSIADASEENRYRDRLLDERLRVYKEIGEILVGFRTSIVIEGIVAKLSRENDLEFWGHWRKAHLILRAQKLLLGGDVLLEWAKLLGGIGRALVVTNDQRAKLSTVLLCFLDECEDKIGSLMISEMKSTTHSYPSSADIQQAEDAGKERLDSLLAPMNEER